VAGAPCNDENHSKLYSKETNKIQEIKYTASGIVQIDINPINSPKKDGNGGTGMLIANPTITKRNRRGDEAIDPFSRINSRVLVDSLS